MWERKNRCVCRVSHWAPFSRAPRAERLVYVNELLIAGGVLLFFFLSSLYSFIFICLGGLYSGWESSTHFWEHKQMDKTQASDEDAAYLHIPCVTFRNKCWIWRKHKQPFNNVKIILLRSLCAGANHTPVKVEDRSWPFLLEAIVKQ